MPAHIKQKAKFVRAIAFVRTLKRKSFNIYTFSEAEPAPCGFVGCALGWMAHERIFRNLRLEYHGGRGMMLLYKDSQGRLFNQMTAPMALFGISSRAANFLFGPQWQAYDKRGRKASPALVAQRMERFLETGEMTDYSSTDLS